MLVEEIHFLPLRRRQSADRLSCHSMNGRVGRCIEQPFDDVQRQTAPLPLDLVMLLDSERFEVICAAVEVSLVWHEGYADEFQHNGKQILGVNQ